MSRKLLDLWVGFFVVIGFAAVLFLALRVGNLSSANFAETYQLTAKFDNIGGLKVRGPVKSAGVVVGRVADIQFDAQTFELQAQQLEQLSGQPWQHFPAVRDEGDTAAKAEVWQRQERFQELAQALQARTAELAQASQIKPLTAESIEPVQAKVEAACKACHQEFRSH